MSFCHHYAPQRHQSLGDFGGKMNITSELRQWFSDLLKSDLTNLLLGEM